MKHTRRLTSSDIAGTVGSGSTPPLAAKARTARPRISAHVGPSPRRDQLKHVQWSSRAAPRADTRGARPRGPAHHDLLERVGVVLLRPVGDELSLPTKPNLDLPAAPAPPGHRRRARVALRRNAYRQSEPPPQRRARRGRGQGGQAPGSR